MVLDPPRLGLQLPQTSVILVGVPMPEKRMTVLGLRLTVRSGKTCTPGKQHRFVGTSVNHILSPLTLNFLVFQHAPTEPPPEAAPTGRGFRVKKPSVRTGADFRPTSTLPLGLADMWKSAVVASGDTGAEQDPQSDEQHPSGSVAPSSPIPMRVPLPVKMTRPNSFGIYKCYQAREAIPHDPDGQLTLQNLRYREGWGCS